MLETLSETGEGVEVQLEVEDINEEPQSTPVVKKAGPSPRPGHDMPASFALGSTSSLSHYSRVKLMKAIQSLVRFPSPD